MNSIFKLLLLPAVLVFTLFPARVWASSSAQVSEKLAPTLIIISIDGMRYDYLELHQAPFLSNLAKQGVHVKQLQPVFPSKTFPNHYSLVTGLHPQKHGITDNSMYDPKWDARFAMSMPEEVGNGRWWQGEPIWITAELQGVTAATYFFPGSEAEIKGTRPSYWFKYQHDTPNRQRVDTVLNWLQLPQGERPQLITLYFSDVDSAGHMYGPASKEVAEALEHVDNELAYLVAELTELGLFDQVNLIISSDHGMAEVDQRKHIVLDSLFSANLAQNVRYSREIVSIFPKEGQKEALYQQLAASVPEQVRLYRKSELPARFHYQQHRRIAPIILLAEQPWIFVRQSFLPEAMNDPSFLRARGSHGYDNEELLMQGMLIAHGPAFKQRQQLERLSMVDIYNVMTAVLGLTPADNDGDASIVPLLLKESGN
ncbi:phosphodiesterase [Arsukibacterium ikkense]|uniref:Phosphodiesterase n=1 Tax=Arsukibacterium ikkense TaxID=336831 RepID=A0A0M2V828_9GAMM|nr:ectonucleotide pyrophosphatase/phosphodiesterase [Arsukibacterium ikkense]KKO45313.1 phosphodiesterase [Arsukibacterium ikkense]